MSNVPSFADWHNLRKKIHTDLSKRPAGHVCRRGFVEATKQRVQDGVYDRPENMDLIKATLRARGGIAALMADLI